MTVEIIKVMSNFSLGMYKAFHLSNTGFFNSLEDTFVSTLKARYQKMILMSEF